MTIVKELNELAEKMTGVNPKATTDAQAMNYIEQHYQGGQPSPTPTPTSNYDYIIPSGLYDDIDGEITNADILAVLNEIKDNAIDENGKIKPLRIGIYLRNDDQGCEGFTEMVQYYIEGDFVFLSFISMLNGVRSVSIYYSDNEWFESNREI